MSQYWGDFPISDTGGQIPEGLPSGTYVPVIPNGHGALTAWAAGPERCFRTLYPASAHPPVRVTRGHPSTEPEDAWFEPFTEDDARTQNDIINSYLA